MAFVCTAVGDGSNAKAWGQTVVIPIGYDDNSPLSYSLLIGLAPMAGGDLEYYFCVVEADTTTGEEAHTYSGLDTRQIITSLAHRKLVLHDVMAGTELLLRIINPPRFFCCTYDSDLPEKALTKHMLIAATFGMCGYKVEEQPFRLGKYSWRMELPEPEIVTISE
jgi:hypothetical protein